MVKEGKSLESQGMEIVMQRKLRGQEKFSWDLGVLDVAQDEKKKIKKLLCRCSKNTVRLMGKDVGNVAFKRS